MCNNLNLGLVKIITPTKGHNYVSNEQKLSSNNPNLDLVNINAYI